MGTNDEHGTMKRSSEQYKMQTRFLVEANVPEIYQMELTKYRQRFERI